jgi:cytochrome c55X
MRILVLLLGALAPALAAPAPPGTQRQAELIRLVREDCGACHGMTLKGGLGSPLLPASLLARPPEALVETVLRGRPGTAMPGWSPLLEPEDAAWIVARLREGFPELPR